MSVSAYSQMKCDMPSLKQKTESDLAIAVTFRQTLDETAETAQTIELAKALSLQVPMSLRQQFSSFNLTSVSLYMISLARSLTEVCRKGKSVRRSDTIS